MSTKINNSGFSQKIAVGIWISDSNKDFRLPYLYIHSKAIKYKEFKDKIKTFEDTDSTEVICALNKQKAYIFWVKLTLR